MAEQALRVLAMAYKELDHEPTDAEMENIENNLIFVGMVCLLYTSTFSTNSIRRKHYESERVGACIKAK